MRTVFSTTLVIEVVDGGMFVFSDHQPDRFDCWLKKHKDICRKLSDVKSSFCTTLVMVMFFLVIFLGSFRRCI